MATADFDHRLDRYADLIVKVGLNLRAGQRLLVRAPLEAAPLVRRVATHAYDTGATLVETIWSDPQLLRLRLEHAPSDSFATVSRWWVEAGMEYVAGGDATLSITGVDPYLLRGIEPQRISTFRQAEAKEAAPLSRLMSADAINWCVVAYPTADWAARVFPDAPPAEQQARLFDAIAAAVRLDRPDPMAAWAAHLAELEARTALMNDKQYAALRFRAPGTDLTVGLPYNHRWLGGAAPTGNGITNVANVPTEEIFTAPHRAQTEGTVRASMPLNYGGSLIEEFSLTFKDGRVVDLSARHGEDLLRRAVEMDAGASRLGEVALVPHSSPIAQSGILFLNTLFDENAASHIALGRAYRQCIEGCTDLDEEDFAAVGGNSSGMHLDFMIGSAEMDVDGVTGDGMVEPVMRAGEWAG